MLVLCFRLCLLTGESITCKFYREASKLWLNPEALTCITGLEDKFWKLVIKMKKRKYHLT